MIVREYEERFRFSSPSLHGTVELLTDSGSGLLGHRLTAGRPVLNENRGIDDKVMTPGIRPSPARKNR